MAEAINKDNRNVFNDKNDPRANPWTGSVLGLNDSTETKFDESIVPVKEPSERNLPDDETVSDDDDSNNSSQGTAGEADDELSPSSISKRRKHKKTNVSPVPEDDCKMIAEMIKEMMKTKSPGTSDNRPTSHIDALPSIEIVDDSTVPSDSKTSGNFNKMDASSLQKNRLVSSMFADIKGNSPSTVDGIGSSRGRENSVFAPSAKAPIAASAAMVTGLKKWQIRSKSNDVTNTFTKHPTHMSDIRSNWNEERTRLPFPLLLQIQQEAEPILQNIVRTYKSALGPKHKLTLQAIEKLEKLKIQIHGDGVYT